MSRTGVSELKCNGAGLKVTIVAASWHKTVMDGLISGATRALKNAECEDVSVVRVPGAFELPLGVLRASKNADAVVALGTVIQGGTPHFDYVCQAATQGLTEVALRSEKPVGFGLLTCDTEEQALDRAGLPNSLEDKGAEAADAVIAMCRTLSSL